MAVKNNLNLRLKNTLTGSGGPDPASHLPTPIKKGVMNHINKTTHIRTPDLYFPVTTNHKTLKSGHLSDFRCKMTQNFRVKC